MERHALRDDQFARIEHLLPGRPGTVGRNSELGNRLFVEAVIWKFRVGTPYRRGNIHGRWHKLQPIHPGIRAMGVASQTTAVATIHAAWPHPRQTRCSSRSPRQSEPCLHH